MKEIKETKEEFGYATINLKDGLKKVVNTKTIYTYYQDGTNDCAIQIEKPLDLFGKAEEVK